MASLKDLLDTIKESRSLASDKALADLLKASPQSISNWKHGTRLPDPVACARIAEAAGVPLARVLGIVGEARAISREEKAVWRRLAAAAAIVLMAGLGWTGVTSDAHAKSVGNSISCGIIQSIHYGSIVQFIRRARQLIQHWMSPCPTVAT